MTRKITFKKAYICYLAILLVIVISCLIYVGSVLGEYEDSQPENKALAHFKTMQSAAADGTLRDLIDADISDELVSATSSKLIAAKGTLSCELTENSGGGELLVYTVKSDDERIVDIELTGKTGDTRLIIFPMTDWKVTSVVPAEYNYKLTLPASMTVTKNGEAVSGESTANGRVVYEFSEYLNSPDVVVRDSIGSEVSYDEKTKLSITEYIVQIPSNYVICSADGSVSVPVSTAECTDINDYKYVSQYTEMPKNAVYRLGIIGEDTDFIIRDNLGNTVDYTLDGHTLKIEGQASSPEIPADVYSKDDVLSNARKWSLFMTADLGGANHGYGQVEEFLLPDSYLEEVAYKWATGVDITFTSVHRLDNPPFSEESVTNYIKYNSECFSVDVRLTKVMHLNSGDDVTDTMNCRFYYIYRDGWYVADIQEIIGE
ncbi:MAG: hypothetical protein E7578_01420 [Ruminococcaceae bacterium]|nr:hypothetical protein [Oscillospiraceae bacterium]